MGKIVEDDTIKQSSLINDCLIPVLKKYTVYRKICNHRLATHRSNNFADKMYSNF